MPRTVEIIDTWRQEDGSTALTFMPLDDPKATLPCAHVIPDIAYAWRSVEHGYDPAHPDFAETVTRHILHESHTPAPAHIRADPRYQLGVVHDLAAADEVVEWRFKPEHVAVLREGVDTQLVHQFVAAAARPVRRQIVADS